MENITDTFATLHRLLDEMQQRHESQTNPHGSGNAPEPHTGHTPADYAALAEQVRTLQGTVVELRREIDTLKERFSRHESETLPIRYSNDDYGATYGVIRYSGASREPLVPAPQSLKNSPFSKEALNTMRSNKILSELAAQDALFYWNMLHQNGFVTDQFQPTKKTTKHLAAYIAFGFDKALGLRMKWRSFELLWHMKNLRQSFNREVRSDIEQRERLSSIFNTPMP